MATWLQFAIGQAVSIVVLVVTVLLTVGMYAKKKLGELEREAVDGRIAKAVDEATKAIRDEFRKDSEDVDKSLRKGEIEFVAIEERLKQMVTREVCIQNHAHTDSELAKMRESITGKLAEINTKMETFERKLVSNGNMDVGRKLDEALGILRAAKKTD